VLPREAVPRALLPTIGQGRLHSQRPLAKWDHCDLLSIRNILRQVALLDWPFGVAYVLTEPFISHWSGIYASDSLLRLDKLYLDGGLGGRQQEGASSEQE
jgi:hypothetical protein